MSKFPCSKIKCLICGKPSTGTAAYWQCSASKYHYWRWRTNKLRKAKKANKPQGYWADVLAAFDNDNARAKFLAAHTLNYDARL